MLHHIKHWLLPHKHNHFHPHALRLPTLVLVLALLLGQQVMFNVIAQNDLRILGYATNVSLGDLHSLTNQQRANNGLKSLTLNSRLNSAAQAKAQHMIANDYWSHVAPDGTTPWSFIDSAGYSYQKAGENLAYGFATSSGTVDGWMDSPTHAANILDSDYTEIGFGILNGSDYQGGENTVIVAMYGQPTATPPKVAAQSEPAAPTPPQQESPAVAQTRKPEAPKKKPVPKKTVAEPDIETEVEEPRVVVVSDPSLNDKQFVAPQASSLSNFAAIFQGDAHWSLYLTFGIVASLALLYALKHTAALYQLAVEGEHYVVGHPMLEASLIYASLWLLLAGTYGVIG